MFRAEQIPDPFNYATVRPDAHLVGVQILFGTKGKRRVVDPDKIGKARKLSFSRSFLFRFNSYKKGPRKRALTVLQANNLGLQLPKQLFLSPATGKPYSYRRVYDMWVQAGSLKQQETMPFPGWSPHLGRHTWACYEVLERLEAELARFREDARLAGNGEHTPSFALVDVYCGTVLRQRFALVMLPF